MAHRFVQPQDPALAIRSRLGPARHETFQSLHAQQSGAHCGAVISNRRREKRVGQRWREMLARRLRRMETKRKTDEVTSLVRVRPRCVAHRPGEAPTDRMKGIFARDLRRAKQRNTQFALATGEAVLRLRNHTEPFRIAIIADDGPATRRRFKHRFIARRAGQLAALDAAKRRAIAGHAPGVGGWKKDLEQRLLFVPVDVVFEMQHGLEGVEPVTDGHGTFLSDLAPKFDFALKAARIEHRDFGGRFDAILPRLSVCRSMSHASKAVRIIGGRSPRSPSRPRRAISFLPNASAVIRPFASNEAFTNALSIFFALAATGALGLITGKSEIGAPLKGARRTALFFAIR